MWQQWSWRSSYRTAVEVPQEEVERLLLAQPAELSCRAVLEAANTWACGAVAEGRPRPDVEQQLDAWAGQLCERASSPVRRIGLRLHPAARLRMR